MCADYRRDTKTKDIDITQTQSHVALLPERFARVLARYPSADHVHFCDAQGRTTASLTRTQLDRQARQIAALLRGHGLTSGDRVLLVYSFSLDVIPAFLGCLFAGVIPCPVAPVNPRQMRADLPRFEKLCADSGATLVLTNGKYARYRQIGNLAAPRLTRGTAWRSLPWVRTDTDLPEPTSQRHDCQPDDIAFLQYTSGSTADPKGVMITHRNLMAQIDALNARVCIDDDSKLVAWIPYFHDYCLVAGIVNVLAQGGQLFLMSPLDFLANPRGWFELMSRIKATGTAAPNFAYDYVIEKTTESERRRWDLSSLVTVQSGGEPVQVAAVDRFFNTFSVTGLRADVFTPAYGLAEHVLGVAVAGKRRIAIDRTKFEQYNRVEHSDASSALALIGNGTALDGVTIRIVDPESRMALADGQVGEVWVDSESRASGYWNKPEATKATFAAQLHAQSPEWTSRQFLRTGDLGFIDQGELFVAGRIKDTIIIRGRNLYPQDIEAMAARAHPSIRRGFVVAFGQSLPGHGETLVVVAELKKGLGGEHKQVANAVRGELAAAAAVDCNMILLVKAGTITKTTSGKLKRLQLREQYLTDGLSKSILHRSVLDTEPSSKPPSDIAATKVTEEQLLTKLVSLVSALNDQSVRSVNVDEPLANLAIDSVRRMSLLVEMNRFAGRELDTEAAFDTASLRNLARAYVNATPSQHTRISDRADRYFPLNPSQGWLFEHEGPLPHGWVVGGMVLTPEPVDISSLQEALTYIIEHHDALRLRLSDRGNGWEQCVLASDAPLVTSIDLTDHDPRTFENTIATTINDRRSNLNMIDGPIVDLVALHLPKPAPDRILLLVHHIAVDAFSFELVASDLLRVYEQLCNAQSASLPMPSYLYSDWMQRLVTLSTSQELAHSAQVILDGPDVCVMTPDHPEGQGTMDSAIALNHWLTDAQSERLITELPEREGPPTVMLLLSALVEALRVHTGHPIHSLELVHHGRNGVWPDVDLSTTCGWVSINCPVTLAVAADTTPMDNARAVQRTVSALPRKGLDHGVLRYMHPDAALRAELVERCTPQVKFLWYGQNRGLIQTLQDRYPEAPTPIGPSFDPGSVMNCLHYFYGTQVDGRIRLETMSSRNCVTDATRRALFAGWLASINRMID